MVAVPEPAAEPAGAGRIEAFLDALWLERGLSESTLRAYRTDLLAFAAWQERRGGALGRVEVLVVLRVLVVVGLGGVLFLVRSL